MWQCTGPGPFLEQCFSYCHAAFAGPWVLGLGFWWTCLSHVSFLLDRQHPLPPTSSNDPLCTCLLSTKPPWTKLCMWGCPCAGAGHSHLPLLLSSHSPRWQLCLAPALSRVGSSLGPDLACDLQWEATTVAQNSLGFNFISLWHKGEFLTPGDAFFPLIILC